MTLHATMNAGLTTLLHGAIDYAGTFPPARLSPDAAAANYLRYRTSAESWALGRYICTVAQLETLPGDFTSFDGGGIALLVDGADDADRLLQKVDAALDVVAESSFARAVDVLEVRPPSDLFQQADFATFGNAVQATAGYVADAGLVRATLFFELPPPTSAGWTEMLHGAASAVAEYQRSVGEHGCLAGLKVRTGGLTAEAIPSSRQLAEVVVACRDHGLFWKATAGLHWPLPRFDSSVGARTHGFVNLFAAAALAEARSLSTTDVAAILDDDRPEHFRFTPSGLSWCDATTDVDAIAAARRRGLRSFGSCSFTEPCEGIETLFC
jgi:hypothetical protein